MSKELTVCMDTNGKGMGVFAKVDLEQGSIVWKESIKDREFHQEEIDKMTEEQKRRLFHLGTIEEGMVKLPPFAEAWVFEKVDSMSSEDTPCNSLFLNHSCDPNLVWADDSTLIAWRYIKAGEELTYDYATEDFEVVPLQCLCGAKNCRGLIEGKEWKSAELQAKYGKYFKTFILKQLKKS